jgi:ribosomal protein S18 acetylase RimI-like enzyme
VLALIRGSFAYMDGRIDPPSSMHRLTLADMSEHCVTGEVWTYANPVAGCVFLTERPGRLYVGKLAAALRGCGIARGLMGLAEQRARVRWLSALELEVRIELVENHAVFERFGFSVAGEGSHAGYDRPTFLTMRKVLEL